MIQSIKRLYSYTLLTVLAIFGLSSCGIFKKTQHKNEAANANALLWEISGNGLQKKSYLFGTMHMICEEDYLWTPAMQTAMQSAETLVTEMDISDTKLQMSLAKQMMFGGDTTIEMFLPKEKIEQLDVALKDNLVVKMSYKKMKPTFVSAMLAMDAFTCERQKSYEEIITKYFKSNNKTIIGLESMEEQVAAITAQPYQDAANALYESIMNPEKGRKEMNLVTSYYVKQEIDKMATMIHDDAQYGAMAEDLLYKRNRNWVNILPSIIKQESCFIAVGAAHLGGPQGVIALLKQKGYTLTPIQ